jgi:hypothetical protein
MAALIPLLTSIGGSVGSSLLGKLFGGSPQTTPAQQQVINSNLQTQNTERAAGTNLLGLGQQFAAQPLNYWSSLLSGNRGLATSALAPEIQQIGQGYQTAANTSAALMPRGGVRADVLGNMPFQQQRDISTLFQTLRPQAAQQLSGGAANLLSMGTNALYGSTAAGQGILNQQQAAQQLAQQQGGAIGSGLFSAWQKYGQDPFSNWLKGLGKPKAPGIQAPGVAGGDTDG